MPQKCSKCARANPDEASYCYFDGVVLAGHSINGGPLVGGTQPFPNPFVFPTGITCRNFDQFALACHEHWNEALGLLQNGYFEGFLGGLGRTDLALAAREASKFPDHDRGLDQLLGKLPSHVLAEPMLLVEPTSVNLGQISAGQDRTIELHLRNQGMRLIFGSVTSENCPWLGLGEPPGSPQKLFHFGSEFVIPIQIRGNQLRASPKPLEGRLTVESNAGTSTVTIRAEVPIQPFPDALLAGARSPRRLAEKAQANPKDAAPLFESGAVKRWYESNGWTYPVQGPAASGYAAVQQFFEALGLTPPPKVEVYPGVITLRGQPGQALEAAIEVRTQEKRPVYGHGTSDQPWLEVARANLKGNSATIPVNVPCIPQRDGETLAAKILVVCNGNQRFQVRVTLEVEAGPNFVPGAAPPQPISDAEPQVSDFTQPPVVEVTQAEETFAETVAEPAVTPTPRSAPPRISIKRADLVHAIPAVLLAGSLGIVLLIDLYSPPKAPNTAPPQPEKSAASELLDSDPHLTVAFNEHMRFGISISSKSAGDAGEPKLLTRWADGHTNNTCLKVDDAEFLFGTVPPGKWLQRKSIDVRLRRTQSVWESPNKVRITQSVEIVPGEQTRVLDTCLIRYAIENRDTSRHTVGLRAMLDTYIGANDGVPFLLPGQSQLLETLGTFTASAIPDFIQALERPDPKDPGTVASLGLKLQGVEPVQKLLICYWPGAHVRWEWKPEPINKRGAKPDSCVALYWSEVEMAPGPESRREIAFTYGLGTISGASGQLGLASYGSTKPGGVFTVTAYVKAPQRNQKVTISLPPGLALEGSAAAERILADIQAGKDAQVSWRVRAGETGEFLIKVTSGAAVEQLKVRINRGSLFN